MIAPLYLLILNPWDSDLSLIICDFLFGEFLLVDQLLLELLICNQRSSIFHLTKGHSAGVVGLWTVVELDLELLSQVKDVTMLVRDSNFADHVPRHA